MPNDDNAANQTGLATWPAAGTTTTAGEAAAIAAAARDAELFDLCGTLAATTTGWVGAPEDGWHRWRVRAVVRGPHGRLAEVARQHGGTLRRRRPPMDGVLTLDRWDAQPWLRAIWPHIRATRQLLRLYGEFLEAARALRGRPPAPFEADRPPGRVALGEADAADRAIGYEVLADERERLGRAIQAEAARLAADRPWLPRRGRPAAALREGPQDAPGGIVAAAGRAGG